MFKRKTKKKGLITYKRGKWSKKDYKSKALGYRFVYPEEGTATDKKNLISRDEPTCITDFQYGLLSGVSCAVQYVPQDGMLPEGIDIDSLGRAMVDKMNETATDGRISTYHGVVEFAGKQCIHHSTRHNNNGVNMLFEFYGYNAPNCSVQFAFTCYNDNFADLELLKQAFREFP